MPVAIDNFNLVIPKSVIAEKYAGGTFYFKLDLGFDSSLYHIEDQELYILREMNVDDFDMYTLIKNGLHFDHENYHSTDFAIRTLLNGFLWPADWLRHNEVFMWHEDASDMAIEEAIQRGNCALNLVEKIYGSFDRFYEVIW